MKLVEITPEILVDPEDVSSIQEEILHRDGGFPSGESWSEFAGSVITLKNGRKVFVKGVRPQEVHRRLKP